jgi:hypothetical protein
MLPWRSTKDVAELCWQPASLLISKSAQALHLLHNVAQYGQLLSPKRGKQRPVDDLPTREDDYNGIGQYLMGAPASGCAPRAFPVVWLQCCAWSASVSTVGREMQLVCCTPFLLSGIVLWVCRYDSEDDGLESSLCCADGDARPDFLPMFPWRVHPTADT